MQTDPNLSVTPTYETGVFLALNAIPNAIAVLSSPRCSFFRSLRIQAGTIRNRKIQPVTAARLSNCDVADTGAVVHPPESAVVVVAREGVPTFFSLE